MRTSSVWISFDVQRCVYASIFVLSPFYQWSSLLRFFLVEVIDQMWQEG